MNIFRIEKTDKYYLIYIFKLKLSFSARKNYLKERLCFIEKIKGLFLKDKKYYEKIIPLGRNCEFASNAYRYHGIFESSLFLWTAAGDPAKVIEFIKNPDDLFSQGCTFCDKTAGWSCNKFGFGFHSKNKPKYFKQNDILDTNKVALDKKEIESRVGYLKEKFKKQIKCKDKKLFVITLDVNSNPEYIHILNNLYSVLNEVSTNFDLLIVIEQNQYHQDIKDFEQQHENVYIRLLEKFSDVQTANKPLDALGWTKIFNEFKPLHKPDKRKRKKLKFEK